MFLFSNNISAKQNVIYRINAAEIILFVTIAFYYYYHYYFYFYNNSNDNNNDDNDNDNDNCCCCCFPKCSCQFSLHEFLLSVPLQIFMHGEDISREGLMFAGASERGFEL